MQSKEIIIEPKIQNTPRLFVTVNYLQFVAFVTFFIGMILLSVILWLTIKLENR